MPHCWRIRRHLDDDAVDHPRQSRDQLSSKIAYGLYEVTAAPEGNWAKAGDKLILADKLAADVMKAAKVEASSDFERVAPMIWRSSRARIR